MSSPTQRTKKWLENAGFLVGITEKWNPYAKIRQDLFGWIDLVAISPTTRQIIGVQTTSGSNHSKRRQKILASAEARAWVESGGLAWVMSWSKKGARWASRIESLTIDAFK